LVTSGPAYSRILHKKMAKAPNGNLAAPCPPSVCRPCPHSSSQNTCSSPFFFVEPWECCPICPLACTRLKPMHSRLESMHFQSHSTYAVLWTMREG
jgi:hypothetical protein